MAAILCSVFGRHSHQNTDVANEYERTGWKRIDGRTVTRIVRSALEIF